VSLGLPAVNGAIVPQSGMFGRIHEHRALLPVLSGLLFLALCNNTVFSTFCPHLSARSTHCLTHESSSSSHINANSGTMSHEHDGDMAMSDTDESELPFQGSTTAEARISVTDAQVPCSHCMMHPQSGVNSPSAPIVVTNSTSHDIAPAASSTVSAFVTSPLVVVDVHDHGPPGLNSSRYILNSTFRI
jgi:hypothetical protein